MEGLIGGEDGLSSSCFHWFSKNAIAVEVVEDKEVVVAVARGGDESSCLVGINLACWFEEGSVAMMRSVLIGWTGGEGVIVIGVGIGFVSRMECRFAR